MKVSYLQWHFWAKKMNHLLRWKRQWKDLERLGSLYQVKLGNDVNEARHKLLTKKKKLPPPQSLSSTKDALSLHIECANYQCKLWKKLLHYHPYLPHPIEHGWTDVDGSLAVQWGHLKSALYSILEYVSCSCKKSECATNHCSSAAVNLPCTGLCCCTNCKNNDIKNELTLMRSSMMMIIGEYQDGDTDREADDPSDCSQGELSEDDEIDND